MVGSLRRNTVLQKMSNRIESALSLPFDIFDTLITNLPAGIRDLGNP